MDRLDPARTALLVAHMAKGVAGDVDTPFNRLFRRRAEEKGVIRVQARLLDGFRTAKAKMVYTLVTYQPGLRGVRPNSPLFRTLIETPTLLRALPRSRSSTTSPPGPVNRSSGDRRPTGLTAPHSTPFSAWQASTPSCSSASPPTSPSNPPPALHPTCNTGRSSFQMHARPTAMMPTHARSTYFESGSARRPPPMRSSAP
jgi:hypothetical protein